MIPAGKLLEDVSRYLTDYDETNKKHQFVEWTKLDLMHYLRISVLLATSAMPRKFAKQIKVTLNGQTPIQLPPECEQFLGIVTGTDADGKRIELREAPKEDTIYTIRRELCGTTSTSGKPAAISVRQSNSNDDALDITPHDAQGTLTVDCYCPPAIDGPDSHIDIPKSYEPVIFWWMVSMAFGTDIESVPMRERSDAYWARGVGTLTALAPMARVPDRPKP